MPSEPSPPGGNLWLEGVDAFLGGDGDATSLDGTSISLTPGAIESRAIAAALVGTDTFRDAMAGLASGVVVVTTRVGGRPWGVTVSACCSVSADPPQILISLNRSTVAWRAIRERGTFGVSVLSAAQLDVARYCAAPGAPKFCEQYSEPTSSDDASTNPMLTGALCFLDCAVIKTLSVATHMLLIGGVTGATMTVNGYADPLLYVGRRFHKLGDAL